MNDKPFVIDEAMRHHFSHASNIKAKSTKLLSQTLV